MIWRERAARCLPEIIIELPAHCLFTLLCFHPRGLTRRYSKRLNGRFRSRPSYDHPAVSRSPLVELRPREFVVALLRELRPLMRGLGSRAAVRRQTINSCVRIWRIYNDGRLPHTMRCLHLIHLPPPLRSSSRSSFRRESQKSNDACV